MPLVHIAGKGIHHAVKRQRPDATLRLMILKPLREGLARCAGFSEPYRWRKYQMLLEAATNRNVLRARRRNKVYIALCVNAPGV